MFVTCFFFLQAAEPAKDSGGITTMLGLDSMFDEVKRMNGRQLIFQVLNFGMIIFSALMIWKVLLSIWIESCTVRNQII